ncbi:hypothetical protein H0X09_01440 [Candidatus Saccharibacteria bacterium]|nr:hypothetical protein [Candidatus Saccharibacteria bacterium]
MTESYAEILTVGGKSNSLGRTNEVIEQVLNNKNQLDELYSCVFNEDAWIRMRAVDALEKICRQHPDWLLPYVDKFQVELGSNGQPSIQWHLAQIYSQVSLSPEQKLNAINWLKHLLSNTDVDWIVAANAMQTLVQFTKDGSVPQKDTVSLLNVQQKHKSNSVIRRANKLLAELSS